MPILTPEESLELFMRNIPGSTILPDINITRQEQAADPEQMRDPFDILTGLQERFQPMVERMFPNEAMSEEDRNRLRTLSQEHERLAPFEGFHPGSLGSPATPGNPYSVDTRGAAGGIGNIVTALLNRRREGQRDEIAGELSGLQDRAMSNIEAQRQRDEFWKQHFPDLFAEASRQEREQTTQAGRVNLENVRHQNQRDLEELRQEGREELVRVRAEAAGAEGVSPSLVSGFSNVARNTANFFAGKAQELRKRKDDDFFDPELYGGDIDRDIQELERKAAQAFNIASKAFSDQRGVDSSLMKDLENVLGVSEIEEVDVGDIFQ